MAAPKAIHVEHLVIGSSSWFAFCLLHCHCLKTDDEEPCQCREPSLLPQLEEAIHSVPEPARTTSYRTMVSSDKLRPSSQTTAIEVAIVQSAGWIGRDARRRTVRDAVRATFHATATPSKSLPPFARIRPGDQRRAKAASSSCCRRAGTSSERSNHRSAVGQCRRGAFSHAGRCRWPLPDH